jgi:hypothetical protein
MEDEAAGEVAAMQFAGGRTIADVAAEWERDAAWLEAAIRQALRVRMTEREGGLRPTRAAERAERNEGAEELQAGFEWQS